MEKREPSYTVGGMHTGAATVENSMEFPQKTKDGTVIWSSNSTAGIIPDYPEALIQKNLCTPIFIAVLFTIVKCWKQPKCWSVNEQVLKLWYIHIMEYYTAERKKELLHFMTAQVDLESIVLSEISQAVKDKYHMISLLTGI